jgi:hypothetical protein
MFLRCHGEYGGLVMAHATRIEAILKFNDSVHKARPNLGCLIQFLSGKQVDVYESYEMVEAAWCRAAKHTSWDILDVATGKVEKADDN